MFMDNVFVKYLSKQAKKEKAKVYEPGPVITISRQYGCYGTDVAQKLAENISKLSTNPWDYITKEILEESAKHLGTGTHEIANIFGADEKSFLSDLVVSFSTKTYKSDSLIKKTIQSVVKTYAEQGNCIIVGRAGCIIAKNIPKSLHVRLVAPFRYRVNRIQERYDLSEKDAVAKVKDTDKKRQNFMKFFKGDLPDDEVFDLIINREKMTCEEIIETIKAFAGIRKLF